MKIVHCLNHFLPGHIAGTEVYVWALSKQLQQMGCEVKVIIPNYQSSDFHEYEYDGLPVYCYPEPSKNDRAIVTGKQVAEGVKYFTAYIQEQRPDIVHFHDIAGSNGISVAHFEAAKSTGAKVIFTIHLAGNSCRTGSLMYEGKTTCDGVIDDTRCGYCALVQKTGNTSKARLVSNISLPFYQLNINPVNWQNKIGTALSYPFQIKKLRNDLERIVNACDKLIPITNWYHNILKRNGVPEYKMKTILQALPIKPNVAALEKSKGERPIKLIFVGRIDELKGVSLLLDVMKNINPNELQVDIYGSAPEADYLEKCERETAAYSHIRWAGKLKQDAVVSTMKQYDALILPSMFSEMSPLVVQEALAAGIPVIGSNVYGIAEQVQDEVNGLLFDFGSASSLKMVLDRLIAEKDLLENITSFKTVPRQFEEVAEETLQVYKSVIQKKSLVA